jgi:Protein of unknown function (DUF2793).
MSGTARLAMPFLSVGQAQKELLHNEALQILDALVAAAVEGPPQASAPASPVVGACYLVAADATGDWATKPQCVACYTSGGWRFIEPAEGMMTYIRSDGVWATYRAGAWEMGAVRGSNLILDGQQVVGGAPQRLLHRRVELRSIAKRDPRSINCWRQCGSTD